MFGVPTSCINAKTEAKTGLKAIPNDNAVEQNGKYLEEKGQSIQLLKLPMVPPRRQVISKIIEWPLRKVFQVKLKI